MGTDFLNETLQKAENGDLTALQLVGAAEKLKNSADLTQVASLYQTWVDNNEKDPLLYAILFNQSAVLSEMGDWNGAREVLERSTELNAEFAPSRINLGRIYERMGQADKTIGQWNTALERLSNITPMVLTHKITALNQMARVLEGNNQDTASEKLLKESLELNNHQREVIQHYLAARQRLCRWPLVEPWDKITRPMLMEAISPLSISVYSDDPLLQLAVNDAYNKMDVGAPVAEPVSSYWAATEGHSGDKMRIGYVSSDLREHAIGYLMAEMFELHNHDKFEIYVYYCGIDREDEMKERISSSVDHWIDIREMSDEEAARRMADDGIQILVDVNAYTRDGRTQIFPLRPAPVIVNWLGFPGSTASPYHHYILADDFIIPEENEIFFSEKVLRLPCYQPNDRKRKIDPNAPTRKEMGLPEDAMVYCCFNGAQKISKYTFDRWLEILRRVPDSVLWLLSSTEEAHENLRAYAKENKIDPTRIIFAAKMANAKHLARYPLADLFLDTAPYGAHTTASDALFMGLPVLTFYGRAFASRVCGSLVRAAGLPELACAASKDYVDRAVALGKDRKSLEDIRQKLAENKESCDLFNMDKLTGCLEDLYIQMWDDFEKGNLPQPDLRNLDVYLEVGSQQDHDALEVQSLKDYKKWWQEALSKRNAYRPIAPDNRFWKDEK